MIVTDGLTRARESIVSSRPGAAPRELPIVPTLGPFSPAEYVQLAGLGAHSVALHCVDAGGQSLGSIVMQGGQVHSARHADLCGFDAFALLVARSDARVILGEVEPAKPDADLSEHWQVLVLEAMRRHDEHERRSSLGAKARVKSPSSELSGAPSEPSPSSRARPLARAASIPVLPVNEMRDTLGSTRHAASEGARSLVEEGVRAVIEKDYLRAIRCFEGALAADPKNSSVRHRLARLYAIAPDLR